MADVTTPYSSASPYFGALPTWMSTYDAERTDSYRVYTDMYRNAPGTYKVVQRGSDASPIYVPKARTLIDAINRYTAPKLTFMVDPDGGTPADQELARLSFTQLFVRERWAVTFAAAKRAGLTTGDWAFHLVADPEKADGRRISIYALDVASLFRIEHPEDVNRITGYHLVSEFTNEDGDSFIQRQTYSKGPDPYDPSLDDGRIWSSLGLFDKEDWNGPRSSPVNRLVEPYSLPDDITALPIYHIRNKEEPNNPWGTSELAGMERLLASLNQAVSDEDIALALEGLGLYATTSGPPQVNGRDAAWKIGPGRVVELDPGAEGAKAKDIFDRVSGVSSVAPYNDYIAQAERFLQESIGVPAAALGSVEVAVAESGVALALRLGPIVSAAEEKEEAIRGTLSQMYFDLKSWFAAYEGVRMAEEVSVLPIFGEKLPINKPQRVREILSIVSSGLASPEWGRLQLAELGYTFDADEGAQVDAARSSAAVAADPYAGRADQELAAPAGEE